MDQYHHHLPYSQSPSSPHPLPHHPSHSLILPHTHNHPFHHHYPPLPPPHPPPH